MFYIFFHRKPHLPQKLPIPALKQEQRLKPPVFLCRKFACLLFGLGSLISFLPAEAEVIDKCLVLLKNDETTALFPLTAKPKLRVDPGEMGLYDNLVFETEEGQLSFYASWELNKLEIKDFSSVESPKLNNDIDIRITGKELIVVASVEALPYSLTDMNGRTLVSRDLPIGTSVISLSDYQAGIYIIAIGNQTIKVRIR